MDVDLIAKTAIDLTAMIEVEGDWVPQMSAGDAELLIEYAGRACYQSWNNPAGRSNAEYIGNIIDHAHFSVLEHASVSFHVRGVSRSLTHELVRHRHFSPSQLSQRFVNSATANYVTPPALEHMLGYRPFFMEQGADSPTIQDMLDQHFQASLDLYNRLYETLRNVEGAGLKAAREAARAVLPNMTATELVITGNHRSWREFLQKRHSTHADAEIADLAMRVLILLKAEFPAIYADIDDKPSN